MASSRTIPGRRCCSTMTEQQKPCFVEIPLSVLGLVVFVRHILSSHYDRLLTSFHTGATVRTYHVGLSFITLMYHTGRRYDPCYGTRRSTSNISRRRTTHALQHHLRYPTIRPWFRLGHHRCHTPIPIYSQHSIYPSLQIGNIHRSLRQTHNRYRILLRCCCPLLRTSVLTSTTCHTCPGSFRARR